MSYLLFMDESGHDHKVVPYEVRGGICLQIGRLWPFIQAIQASGMDAECRAEIADEFGPWLRRLQYQGDGYNHMTHEVFRTFGITFVPDPYGART